MSTEAKNKSAMVALPKSGGAISGIGEMFSPDPFTGVGSLHVPIALSPGRSGFAPKLGIYYSTANGNGPFGLGWKLDIADISRKTQDGLPRYSTDDKFVLSGADELVLDAGSPAQQVGEYVITRYRPRVERSFSRIEHWRRRNSEVQPPKLSPSFWRVTTPDNITSIFGLTTQAILADPDIATHVFRWSIELTYDGKGNFIHYVYKHEDGKNIPNELKGREAEAQIYLKRVRYANRKPTDFMQIADLVSYLTTGWSEADCLLNAIFDYGEHSQLDNGEELITGEIHKPQREWSCRPDPFSSQRSGFGVRSYRQCKRVLMFHQFAGNVPLLVRSTDFLYQTLEHNQMTTLVRVTQRGYQPSTTDSLKYSEEHTLGKIGIRSRIYDIKSIPSLQFEYAEFEMPGSQTLVSLTQEGGPQPQGMRDANCILLDLFGRGVPDILETRRDGYRYWRNLGDGRFSAMEHLKSAPSYTILSDNGIGLADITGTGAPDLLEFSAARSGFYPAAPEGGWQAFRSFVNQPPFTLWDHHLRFLDLTGDGRFDALRTALDKFVVYEALGATGFVEQPGIPRKNDLGDFPNLDFIDPNVHLVDMTGDGLADIVLLEPSQGEVHYWPNRGFGQFGRRVTMKITNLLTFDPKRMFFIDIDGSGPTDLVHIESGRIRFWLNESGNAWSPPHEIKGTPLIGDPADVELCDILGNGMAGILFSQPSVGIQKYRFLPMTGPSKPGLLTAVHNNMGLTTRFTYTSSTALALKAEQEGKPWLNRLPFPVYVLEQLEKIDQITGTKTTTLYDYAHGRYDEQEKEFVGFGRVDQQDSESLGDSVADVGSRHELDQPPVLTTTWFHTGADFASTPSLRPYSQETYTGDPNAHSLLDSTLPANLPADERHDALRALRGRMLRQEVYSLDGSAQEKNPYSVVELSYRVRPLQSAAQNIRPVFSAYESERIEYAYERDPRDPRIAHHLTLEVDEFNHVTVAADVAYPRRSVGALEHEQSAFLVKVMTQSYAQQTDKLEGFRHGAISQEKAYELTGLQPPAKGLITADTLSSAIAKAAPLHYEDNPTSGALQKRLIAWTKYTYWDDMAQAVLTAGRVGLLALPHNVYKLALTPGLLKKVFAERLEPKMLQPEGGYYFSDEVWWALAGSPSKGQQVFDSKRFFLPTTSIDPFGALTKLIYDEYGMLVTEITDALGNSTRVKNDYRVLLPSEITDPNGNRQAIAFDALGIVVGTAVMGKQGEQVGDALESFTPNLDDVVLQAYLQNPTREPEVALQKATTRIIYDLWRFCRSDSTVQRSKLAEPVVVCTLTRETHAADLAPGSRTVVQHSFLYQDGFGRILQTKIQAEPGLAPIRDAKGSLNRSAQGDLHLQPNQHRWVGTGRTIYNNKGNPIKKYEPFFSDTHLCEREDQLVMKGVTVLLHYDPLGRLVKTSNPNGTFSKVEFSPWMRADWDENDTVLDGGPQAAPNPMQTALKSSTAPFNLTGYGQRERGALGPAEQAAARKAALHAGTPTVNHLDTLGRVFVAIAHNRYQRGDTAADEKYSTRSVLDIEGRQREVIDAKQRVVMCYAYDMLGNRIRQESMEAGTRWILPDTTSQPIRAWNGRGFAQRTTYDVLRRVTGLFVSENGRPEFLAQKTEYGDTPGILTHPEETNHRGRVYRVCDGVGNLIHGGRNPANGHTEGYDFKGNLLRSTRQLLRDYKNQVDWSTNPALEGEAFSSAIAYDALSRPIQYIAPHSDRPGTAIRVIQPIYNEANLLERLDTWLAQPTEPTGLLDSTTASIHTVTNIDYNARGQRTLIEHGNGVRTTYDYDPLTFRLARLCTLRGAEHLQDLSYTYDPVGNITHIQDNAQQTIFFRNQRVEPSNDYSYDAIYRLIEATGREHLGQNGGGNLLPPTPASYNDKPRVGLVHPNDGNAMGVYREQYIYDEVGNFVEMRHQMTDPSNGNWTRSYVYNETSLLESGKKSNRLTQTILHPNGNHPQNEEYAHDAHGNMTRMPHLQLMQWDFQDQLCMTQRQAVNNEDAEGMQRQGERTYYVYDAAGQRVRKVSERQNGARSKERIYLGGFEIYREYNGNGSTVTLERETLHIMDDRQRIALVETRTKGNNPAPPQLIRYQFGNHLGSASLELDDQAQVISYEEYTPYGNTSYQAVRSQTEMPKRYRFTGKERDEESGLYSLGVRYYAVWIGRWTRCDPVGIASGSNAFEYSGCNPIIYRDTNGRKPEPFDDKQKTGANEAGQQVSPNEIKQKGGRELRTGKSWTGKETREQLEQHANKSGFTIKGDVKWEKGYGWRTELAPINQAVEKIEMEAERIVVPMGNGQSRDSGVASPDGSVEKKLQPADDGGAYDKISTIAGDIANVVDVTTGLTQASRVILKAVSNFFFEGRKVLGWRPISDTIAHAAAEGSQWVGARLESAFGKVIDVAGKIAGVVSIGIAAINFAVATNRGDKVEAAADIISNGVGLLPGGWLQMAGNLDVWTTPLQMKNLPGGWLQMAGIVFSCAYSAGQLLDRLSGVSDRLAPKILLDWLGPRPGLWLADKMGL